MSVRSRRRWRGRSVFRRRSLIGTCSSRTPGSAGSTSSTAIGRRAVVQPLRRISRERASKNRLVVWRQVGKRAPRRRAPSASACRSAESTARRWIASVSSAMLPRCHEQSLDLIVDQAAQVGGTPPDDRHSGGQRLADGGAVRLDSARERERVGGRYNEATAGGLEWRRGRRPDRRGRVVRCGVERRRCTSELDVGATREMQGDVVSRKRGDGVEQLDDPLVRQPVGDVEQSEAAPGPASAGTAPAGARSQPGSMTSTRSGSSPCSATSSVGNERPGRDDEVAGPVGGDVETTTEACAPSREPSDPPGCWCTMATVGGRRLRRTAPAHLPGVQAVDHDDIGRRQPTVHSRAWPPDIANPASGAAASRCWW